LQISGGAFLATGKDQAELEQAFERSRNAVAFYGSTRTYRISFELEG
jgi:hypothetical protein